MKGLANKRVIVTGAAQGIGLAVAHRFRAEGCSIAMIDAKADVVAAAAEQVRHTPGAAGATVHHGTADVSDEAEVEAAINGARAALGGVDILVNNAGINRGHASHDFPLDDFNRVLSVNLTGAFLCSRAVLRIFLDQGQGGVILNNSSNHEVTPKPGFVAYAVSKSGLGNLTRTLALEYAQHGIRVNGVAPGAVVTPLNASWTENPQKRANVAAHIPLGRAARAEEIAGVFAFLASDDASYITGQTLFADGGLALYPEYRFNWAS